MTDGSLERFIARTDPAGRTVQSLSTGRFLSQHVCEDSHGTAWALGLDTDFHVSLDADLIVLCQFDFVTPLSRSPIWTEAISAAVRTAFRFISRPLPSTFSSIPPRASSTAGM